MAKYDDEAEATKILADALRELPENYVMCRDYRHAWMTQNDFHVINEVTEGRQLMHIQRDSACMRCPTIRHEVYIVRRVRSGNNKKNYMNALEKIRQWYEYPQGYQIPGVPRGVKPSWIIQQEMYRRMMERVAHANRGEREHAER